MSESNSAITATVGPGLPESSTAFRPVTAMPSSNGMDSRLNASATRAAVFTSRNPASGAFSISLDNATASCPQRSISALAAPLSSSGVIMRRSSQT